MSMWRLACALLVVAGCKDGKAPARSDRLEPLDGAAELELVYEVTSPTGQRSIDQAAETIDRRIAAMGIARGSVTTAGRQVIVRLAKVASERVSELRSRVVGDLSFRMVAHGTDFMRKAFAMAQASGGAVQPKTDVWSHDGTGNHFRDWYVVAEEPRLIHEFFARFTRETGTRLGDDELIAVELLERRPRDPGGKRLWRSYVVRKRAALTGAAVKAAKVQRDKHQNRPEVMVELTAAGQRTFAELTRNNLGSKLAIFLGDQIKSAPVIQTPIPGGKVVVTMGGTDPKVMDREARDLVAVLRSGALAQPLKLVSVKRLK